MQEYLKVRIDLDDPRTVAAYDELPLWSAMFGLMLLEHVELRPNLRVLDAGCGTGFPLLELAQRLGPTCTVCGLDPWGAALDRARAKMEAYGVRNVELRRGDAAAMPFADGEFDRIVSNLGINNFENPDAVFAECHRVLKPSGALALTTNLVGHMKEFYDAFEATLAEAGDHRALEALRVHVDHRATVSKVEAMLSAHGFRLSRVHEAQSSLRFADGTALFHHYFIQLGFLGGWKGVLEGSDPAPIFASLEARLNRIAAERGGLELTIPMAYIEAARMP